MNWLFPLARVIGAGVPFGSVLVQVSAEVDAHKVQQRLAKLEDPISSLHPDVREFSRVLYERVRSTQEIDVQLPEDDLSRFARVIAILERSRHLRGVHAAGQQHPMVLWVDEPQYLLYMAALYEDADAMGRLVHHVDTGATGTWLRGEDLAAQYGVPLPVVGALFKLFESRGLGLMSNEIGATNYMCKA